MTRSARRTAAAMLLLLSLAWSAASCGKNEVTGPTSYIVRYQLITTGTLTFDSVKYDDGHGALVKVAAPAGGWTSIISVAVGGSVEASAWGTGAPASSANLKIIWTASGFSTQSDSSTVTTTSPAKFSLSVAHRKI